MTQFMIEVATAKLALAFALALLAWVVQRTLNRPRLTHAVWLLVLLTMLVPMLFRLELFDLASFSGEATAGTVNELAFGAASNAAEPANGLTATITGFLPQSFAELFVFSWITGSAVVLLLSLVRVVQFNRALRGSSYPASHALNQMAVVLAGSIGLRRLPRIITTSARVSPLVWWRGIHPIVVMPASLAGDLHEDQLKWMLAHELTHIRRGDHIVRFIEWLTSVAFWWNPVTWLARRNLRSAEEMCCDAHVLSVTSAAPREYARALLAVVTFLSVPPQLRTPALAMRAATSGNTVHLERRIKMIISGKSLTSAPRRGGAAVWVLAALLLPLGFINLNASAQDQRQTVSTRARQECDALIAYVRTGVESGYIEAGLGKILIENCQVADKLEVGKKLSEKAAAGQITEYELAGKKYVLVKPAQKVAKTGADAEYELREYVLDVRPAQKVAMTGADKEKLAELKAKLGEAVAVGTITEDEAKAKLAAAIGEKPKAASKMTKADCDKITVEIRAAIDAGKITIEQGLQKYLAACGG